MEPWWPLTNTPLLVTIGVFACAALAGTGRALLAVRKVPLLRDVAPTIEGAWPTVTLVIAACNEADTIEPAATTLLACDYPDLQVVLVNDRSTDATGAIIDRLAAGSERATAVHITELPDGWLGKVHAMHVGTQAAVGDYIVYCDADVHFAPGALQRAVAFCEREGLGHLSLLPRIDGGGFWLDASVAAFATGFLATLRVADLGDPDTGAFAGIGAFNMVRREAFERTEGWSWLKMDVIDDSGLAFMMVTQAKARSLVPAAGEFVRIRWYPSVAALIRGLGKNAYIGLAHGQWRNVLRFGVGLPLMALSVVLAPLSGDPVLLGIFAAIVAVQAALSQRFADRIGHPRFAAACGVLMFWVLGVAVLRSTWLTLRAGGITWRGTFYPLAALRAGKRVWF